MQTNRQATIDACQIPRKINVANLFVRKSMKLTPIHLWVSLPKHVHLPELILQIPLAGLVQSYGHSAKLQFRPTKGASSFVSTLCKRATGGYHDSRIHEHRPSKWSQFPLIPSLVQFPGHHWVMQSICRVLEATDFKQSFALLTSNVYGSRHLLRGQKIPL